MKFVKEIWSLLRDRERKSSVRVSISVLVSALLDFASLAALIPVLYYLLEGSEHRKAALLFCLIALSISGLKYFVSTRCALYQQRFLLDLYKRISISLYCNYYRRGLLFIRQNGFSKLNYEINSLCYNFCEGILASMLQMVGDGVLLLIMMVAITIYSPLCLVILVVCFIPFVLVYLRVVRKKAKIYGEQVIKAKRAQGRIVNDTFSGYVELEVNDTFDLYKERFLQGMNEIQESKLKMVRINRLPSVLTEIAVIGGLTVVSTGVFGDVKILLGVFVVAAFKLLPALKAILSGWTRIQSNMFSVEVISQGLSDESLLQHPTSEVTFEKGISFHGVSYEYPDSAGKVLDNLSFGLSKGEYVGLRGYSGVGKTTLFNLLLGFLQPTEGEVLIDNDPLSETNRDSWLSKIGYVPQDVFIFRGNLVDNIAMGDENPDRERIWRILVDLQLKEWLDTLPDGLDTDLCELGSRLSGGQRQRIGLARAIYKNIDLLLLDEATSALDNDTEREINQVIDNLRRLNSSLTIISIAHRESSIAYCDRVINLE